MRLSFKSLLKESHKRQLHYADSGADPYVDPAHLARSNAQHDAQIGSRPWFHPASPHFDKSRNRVTDQLDREVWQWIRQLEAESLLLKGEPKTL